MLQHSQLLDITKVFLQDNLDYLALTEAIQHYKEILQSLAPIDLENLENRKDIQAKGGLAIGPAWAALCIDDMARTRQFVKGISQAINTVLSKKTDHTPVEILYAGTGPFATLVLCLLPRYTPQQIQLTLLEINPISFQAVQKVFEQLGLQAFVRDFIQENAVTYHIKHTPDIIISETMIRALDKEPQVAIMMNLLDQVGSTTLMIPQNIRLSLGVSRLNSKAFKIDQETLDTLLEITPRNLKLYREAGGFPTKQVKVNLNEWKNYHDLNIDTDIQVYEDCHISFNLSGLTVPKKILDIAQTKENEVGFEFQYQIEPIPELTIKTFNF